MTDHEAELAADAKETRRSHAASEHTYCGVTCEDSISSEMLRNAILCRAIPGSAGMLDELLRRRAAEALREAADEIDQTDLPDDHIDMFDNGASWATSEMRRMAGAVPGPRGNTTSEPDGDARAAFRNCYTDDEYRSALTRSPEQPCGREKPHPAHKHMLARANWQCPGVPAPQGPPGEAGPK